MRDSLSPLLMLVRLLLKLQKNSPSAQRLVPLSSSLISATCSLKLSSIAKMATTTAAAATEQATKRVKLNCISPVPSDIDIAHAAVPLHISRIAASLGLTDDDYDCYGKTMAKVRGRAWRRREFLGGDQKRGRKQQNIDRSRPCCSSEPPPLSLFYLSLFLSFSQPTNTRSSSPSSTAPHPPPPPPPPPRRRQGASTSSSPG